MTKLFNKTPSVCVIIVSYNFIRWIHQCISSVMASRLPATILVIDNGSNDNTCMIIRNEYPEVVLIENNENLGFGKANNIGMKYAKEAGFDYMFLLNQDAWIESDTLEKLIEAAEKNKEYAILSPVHLNAKGDATDFGFSEYTHLKNKKEALELLSEVTEFPFINAAMWLIPVRVIVEVGVFAPIFAHYGEDRNFVHRIQKHGYKLGLVRATFGYHDRTNLRKSLKQKYYSEFVYFLTEAVNPKYSWIKATAYSVLASFKKAIKSLLSSNKYESKEYFHIVFRLLGKCSAIRHTRKEQRIRQAKSRAAFFPD